MKNNTIIELKPPEGKVEKVETRSSRQMIFIAGHRSAALESMGLAMNAGLATLRTKGLNWFFRWRGATHATNSETVLLLPEVIRYYRFFKSPEFA